MVGGGRLVIDEHLSIGLDELEESFIRASGPGGQNVNKVSTAVQLRLDVRQSPSLPLDVKARLARLAGWRMTQDGLLQITARRFRTQDRNRADAREALVALLRAAAVVPIRRRKTRPPISSKAERLDDKSRRATTKRQRRVKPDTD